MNSPRHGAWWLLVTIVALIIGSVLLFRLTRGTVGATVLTAG